MAEAEEGAIRGFEQRAPAQGPLTLHGTQVQPGTHVTIDLPVAQLYTHTALNIPLQVFRGRRAGPVLLLSAAIHGDELNGIEIIRRILRHRALGRLRGTLIAAPVVNVFGFIHRERYLPDRRDLNRCFPGSERGSLGSRVADLFKREVLDLCTHVVDLHTGAIHRSNLPQIRADMSQPDVAAMARAFGLPVILDSSPLAGSMREVAGNAGIVALVYEAGEALRFEEASIRAGVRGCIRVMRHLGMLPPSRRSRSRSWAPFVARSSQWVRADIDGVFRPHAELGAHVKKDDLLGKVSSPMGEGEVEIRAPAAGVLIGRNNIPLVNEGEALFHIARFDELGDVVRGVEAFRSVMLEGDEPIDPPVV
ncbi:MAG: succinylglutamate desuccinylase/aspartoacylase family protein [Pseudomonadales bacterium]|nr:succinylglutamate desuccinylase/aspartoacylase family protein [Pseudomonadales bacterium]